MTIKTELHVCNYPKDTADLYFDRYSNLNSKVALVINNNSAIVKTDLKYMIFCTVEQLEKYCYGYEFTVVVYHGNTIAKITNNMFAMLLTRERR